MHTKSTYSLETPWVTNYHSIDALKGRVFKIHDFFGMVLIKMIL